MSDQKINIALAGYANVGKSVIFNHLTGLHQHIGNWPGKTIEKAEGTLHYKGHTIDVLDLPGIYSLSTYSLEELITREYIISAKPDFIVNVIDATNLERNLILTLQLLELDKPMILVLNMVNLLKRSGIIIDFKKLELILGIPVIPVIAIQGKGLTESLDRGINLISQEPNPNALPYGKEVEDRIKQLCQILQNTDLPYPKRFIAIKLLEKDAVIEKHLAQSNREVLEKAQQLNLELEKIHGHNSSIVIADERCHLASQIAKQVMTVTKPEKISAHEALDILTGHKIWGYPVMIAILGLIFFTVFKSGNYISSAIQQSLSGFQSYFYSVFGNSVLTALAWGGIASLIALIEIALPYILPFYLFLFFLEDFGYLARAAYLMDHLMHKLGIHGKACIPLILGFGCNVPACLSCRIMETQRERFITGLLTVFIPCSAVTVIVAGLVGKYLGIGWALGLYFLVFLIIFILGKVVSIITPGEPTELIMEMPSYKFPHIKTIALQTWFQLKEFIYIAAPIVIISGIIIEGAYWAKLLTPVNDFLAPITVQWLGLPAITGTLLIFGILRKELILVMLASILGTADFSKALSQTQMLILALVSMLYIPCAATIAALYKEFGWQKALLITVFKIALAIVAGGLVLRLLNVLNFHSF
ncbi:MAG TPA: ferrous iron transport protein B [Coxiellaceae bacterium]|nr:MAG: ferrous iron transport protein B [Gammaproteobacteria bacterium RBG_16_37_9]HBC71614.1 ferrous iron transport protein B [Coxiellaceae bacterium]HBS51866.1 ferrous iron transport protein B [Coxiellaceae bacterium]